ncbi:ribosome biogenesis protein BOP1 [Cyclospora cayetanensis]|uniref:Ribosome biogenesis protein BOP1 n=1 Tax=Cyclospora cayetanensis TaxID=88456 RepID=A0A6P6RTB8_9EIME|nr:ribosome biogenesis protein BOP1 [Cyclospora cayetanensis]
MSSPRGGSRGAASPVRLSRGGGPPPSVQPPPQESKSARGPLPAAAAAAVPAVENSATASKVKGPKDLPSEAEQPHARRSLAASSSKEGFPRKLRGATSAASERAAPFAENAVTKEAANRQPEGPLAGKSKRYATLMSVPNVMEVEGEEELLSDDDEDRNRSGAVPLWWYDKYKHIGGGWVGVAISGYDAEGNRVEKTLQSGGGALGELLANAEIGSERWRHVRDLRNDRIVTLSEQDLEAQFLPSAAEQKKINRYIKMIREGKPIRPPSKHAQEETLRDLWGDNIYSATPAKDKLPPAAKAPKLPLPSHAESYNPPEEYLFTPEEEAEWRALPPENRPLPFLPQKFSALRRVPAYAQLVLERYNRCLDLYLCPRAVKHRMNVDPSSLLPQLPPASSFRPFPTSLGMAFLPLTLHAQRIPRPQPLFGFLLPFEDKPNERLEWSSGSRPECSDKSDKSSSSRSGRSGRSSRNGENLLGPEGAAVRVVSVNAAGTFVATGSSDGCLRVFEAKTGRIVAALLLQQQITAAAFHPALPILAVAAAEQLLLVTLDRPLFDSQSLHQLTNAAAAATPKAKKQAPAAATEATAAGEGNGFVSAARRQMEEALELLRVKTALDEELPDLLHTADASVSSGGSSNTDGPYTVDATVGAKLVGCWQQVSMKHAKAAAKSATKELQQLQSQNGEEAHELTLLLRGVRRAVFLLHDSPILKLKWQHKGNYLVSVCPGSSSPSNQLLIHNIRKQKSIKPLRRRGPGALKDAAFHPKEPWLIVAYTRGLRIYDLAAKQQSAGLPGTRQALLKKLIGVESVSSVSVHPSGSQLLVGGENSKLYFFDLELSKRVFKVFRAHKHAISSVAFHETLPLMASSSMDGTVQVYHCRVYDDLMTNPLIVPVKTLKVCCGSRFSGEIELIFALIMGPFGRLCAASFTWLGVELHVAFAIFQVCADATQGGGVTTCFWHPTLPWLFTGDRTGACSLWR